MVSFIFFFRPLVPNFVFWEVGGFDIFMISFGRVIVFSLSDQIRIKILELKSTILLSKERWIKVVETPKPVLRLH